MRTAQTVQCPPESRPQRGPGLPTHVRYNVLLLTFCITFMMYVDRAVMGSATPAIMREFHMTKTGMGWSSSAFNWSYALFQVPGGWLADRSVRDWCSPARWPGGRSSPPRLAWHTARYRWPSRGFSSAWEKRRPFRRVRARCVRWLPVSQRAFGQGFQHAGSRFGAALAPLIVMFLIARLNWQSAFYILGVGRSSLGHRLVFLLSRRPSRTYGRERSGSAFHRCSVPQLRFVRPRVRCPGVVF